MTPSDALVELSVSLYKLLTVLDRHLYHNDAHYHQSDLSRRVTHSRCVLTELVTSLTSFSNDNPAPLTIDS
jgi:hypothetical protein